MIKTALLALVALLYVSLPEATSAQPIDSTLNFAYGSLVEVTNTDIVFNDLLSPRAEPRSIICNKRTVAFGCTFEDVRPGTNLYIELVDSPAGKVAQTVKFEGCAPIVSFDGTILSISGDTLRLKVAMPIPDVSTGAVVLTKETPISDCAGRIVDRAALAIGDEVKVGGYSKAQTLEATYVVIASKCPEYKTAMATLLSTSDKGIVVSLANGERVELVFGSGLPFLGDSLMNGAYTCDGRILKWSEVAIGATLRISYFDYQGASDVLEAAVLEDGCPKPFGGVVASVSDGVIVVKEYDGTLGTYVFDNATQVFSCSNRERTIADIQPGVGVHGAWIEDGTSRKLINVQLTDGCAYAFAEMGVITEISDNSMTIRTMRDSLIVLTIDNQSMLIDCFGFVERPTRLLRGDTVSVFYSQDRGTNYLDLVQFFQNCEREKLSGVIVAATETAIVMNTGAETQTLIIDSESQLFDCTGGALVSSGDIVGSTITTRIKQRGDTSYVRTAWVDFNCPSTGILGGPIVSFVDSLLVIMDNGIERQLYVADFTIVMEKSGAFADRSALLAGRSVCVITQTSGASLMALQVILDSDCSSDGVVKGVRVQGAVESVEYGKVIVSARGKNVTFATMDITTVQHQRDGMANLSDLATGKSVLVMSERRMSDGTPVAESIVILDAPTGVDDEAVTGNSVLASPNPASDVFHVDGRDDQSVELVAIHDMQGRLMNLARGTRTVSLRDLPVGAYRVSVHFSDARIETLSLSIIR
ncbi:MAG: hypothetical protein NTX15_01375 [Candidatus Kapabacteria bacterium]|nr:hypothetical protein [Candidatus Kapabacteria bacterium]